MRSDNLEFLAGWLEERTGFALARDQMHLVEARLLPLVRRLALGDLDALMGELRGGRKPEIAVEVTDAMMTTETSFFRDAAVFVQLRDRILPALVAARAGSRRLRVWCAAVSTGQEALSIAMLARRHEVGLDGWQMDLLGTDVSRQAIERARAASYSHFEIQAGLPAKLLAQHFRRSQERWVATDALRRAATFKEFNLLADPASLGAFDLVLCRYMLRGAVPAVAREVAARVAGSIAPGGYLALGVDERLPEGVAGLEAVEGAPGIYASTGAEADA